MNQPKKTLPSTAPEQLAFFQRALKAAEKARGSCAPNPFVGAVVVRDGAVLTEGWSQPYGGAHAEVEAMRKAGSKARGSDLYVTLEPCAHYGKTPPCTEAIIAAGIRRVFFGLEDPNPQVNGRGAAQLELAGIEVQGGFLSADVSRQLEYYLCRVLKERPFVIWKAALSLDGRYAARDGSSRWITSELSRRKVHRLRQEADVVLTGCNTVLCDDPMLNVRLPKTRKQPVRAVLDPQLRVPVSSRIVQTAGEYPTWFFCSDGIIKSAAAHKLTEAGVKVIPVPGDAQELDLTAVLDVFHAAGYYCVLLECGSSLASSFFAARLVDKCVIFYGPKLLGNGKPILSGLPIPNICAAIDLENISVSRSGSDIQVTGYPVWA